MRTHCTTNKQEIYKRKRIKVYNTKRPTTSITQQHVEQNQNNDRDPHQKNKAAQIQGIVSTDGIKSEEGWMHASQRTLFSNTQTMVLLTTTTFTRNPMSICRSIVARCSQTQHKKEKPWHKLSKQEQHNHNITDVLAEQIKTQYK